MVLAPGQRSPCIQKPPGFGVSARADQNATVEYYAPDDPITPRSIDINADPEGQVNVLWIRNEAKVPNQVRLWFMASSADPQKDLLAASGRREMSRTPDFAQTLEPHTMTQLIPLAGRAKRQFVVAVDGAAKLYGISGSAGTSMVRCCGYPCDTSSLQTAHHIRVLNEPSSPLSAPPAAAPVQPLEVVGLDLYQT